jgi:hypothetical protein
VLANRLVARGRHRRLDDWAERMLVSSSGSAPHQSTTSAPQPNASNTFAARVLATLRPM